MKSSGVVRKLDELGRVVLPVELRRKIKVSFKDTMEITVDGECIVLKKHKPRCVFCKNTESITEKDGKNICKECLEELKKL